MEETNKMNIENLRTFVKALNNLPDEIKNNNVRMHSLKDPLCGFPGCFGGLVSMVPLPALKEYYGNGTTYDYEEWADALANYLGFEGARSYLEDWAKDNPKLWGNNYGISMFANGGAYGQKKLAFPHSVIIAWWTAVLERCLLAILEGEYNG